MKVARKAKKMSQEQLAVLTGVARQTIGRIEVGSCNPSLQLSIRICKALEVTLDDIFWEA